MFSIPLTKNKKNCIKDASNKVLDPTLILAIHWLHIIIEIKTMWRIIDMNANIIHLHQLILMKESIFYFVHDDLLILLIYN